MGAVAWEGVGIGTTWEDRGKVCDLGEQILSESGESGFSRLGDVDLVSFLAVVVLVNVLEYF